MTKLMKRSIVVMTIIIVLLILIRTNNSIDQVVKEQRPDFVEAYKIFNVEQVNNHILVYSSGIVNQEEDNIYYIDVLDEKLLGHQWLDSRGHINRDLIAGEPFDLSLQLLKHDRLKETIIFGIVQDPNIRTIRIDNHAVQEQSAVMLFTDRDEGIYSIIFEENLSTRPLMITVNYADDNITKTMIITKEQLETLNEGKQIYLTI
jgi:hypothetical protein